MCKTTSFIIITAITLSSFQCWRAMRRRTSACSRVTPRTVQRYWRRDDQPRTQRWINCTLSFVRTSENCRRPMRPRAHDWRHINNVLSVLHEYRETITIKKHQYCFSELCSLSSKFLFSPCLALSVYIPFLSTVTNSYEATMSSCSLNHNCGCGGPLTRHC